MPSVTKTEILTALKAVQDPDLHKDIVTLGFVKPDDVRIADGVQFGVHAAFRAADQTAEIPFFTRRLDAVRCAFR